MATISYIKPPSVIIDPSKHLTAPAKAEELGVNTSVAMQGVLTISIVAPEDDQLLFKLVPETDRQNLLKKVWIQATLAALRQTVNQLVEQAVIQLRLYPMDRKVLPSFAGDAAGNLVYIFQVSVSTYPQQPQPTPAIEAVKDPVS